MMRYAAPADEWTGRSRLFFPASWRADLLTRQAESQYWQQQYELLARTVDGERSATHQAGASYLMLVANATYRQVTGALTDETPVERLDRIARLYLDVLEQDPNRIDAAYNYEFVLRRKNGLLRDRAARRRSGAAPGAAPQDGTALHGTPGATPPRADVDDFKIIVPQRPDERRQQPDAGAGAGKVRKG
jgi:hypothetical protein